jgi:hypothetical protein
MQQIEIEIENENEIQIQLDIESDIGWIALNIEMRTNVANQMKDEI